MPRNVVELSIYRDNLEFEPLPDDVSIVPTQFIRHRSTPRLQVIESLFDSLRWLPEQAVNQS